MIDVSDGGCKSPKGSYGVVIGNTDKIQKATLEGFAKGPPTAMISFLCESYGMLSSFLYMKHLFNYYKIRGNQREIVFYCDGQSLLRRIFSHRFKDLKIKDLLRDDIDMEQQILHEIEVLESMGFSISIHFVRGHQKLSLNSSAAEAFNHVADNLESRNLHRHNCCLPYDLLPTMQVIVEFNKLLMSGKIWKNIKKMVLFPILYEETQKQLKHHPFLTSKLW
jgi:hypothetical protein